MGLMDLASEWAKTNRTNNRSKAREAEVQGKNERAQARLATAHVNAKKAEEEAKRAAANAEAEKIRAAERAKEIEAEKEVELAKIRAEEKAKREARLRELQGTAEYLSYEFQDVKPENRIDILNSYPFPTDKDELIKVWQLLQNELNTVSSYVSGELKQVNQPGFTIQPMSTDLLSYDQGVIKDAFRMIKEDGLITAVYFLKSKYQYDIKEAHELVLKIRSQGHRFDTSVRDLMSSKMSNYLEAIQNKLKAWELQTVIVCPNDESTNKLKELTVSETYPKIAEEMKRFEELSIKMREAEQKVEQLEKEQKEHLEIQRREKAEREEIQRREKAEREERRRREEAKREKEEAELSSYKWKRNILVPVAFYVGMGFFEAIFGRSLFDEQKIYVQYLFGVIFAVLAYYFVKKKYSPKNKDDK
ncbi:MAG: hypothetical protein KBT32_03355 [Bacteroidales bacterium]|nr:hypothetical protein [Candidatus Physcocola equi]